MGALQRYSKKEFGGETRYNDVPITTSVAATATKIWNNNPDRIELIFVNHSVNDINLMPYPTVTTTSGMFLAAGGGTITLKAYQDGELVGREWWGINAVGASTIYTAEVDVTRYEV